MNNKYPEGFVLLFQKQKIKYPIKYKFSSIHEHCYPQKGKNPQKLYNCKLKLFKYIVLFK